MARDLLLIVHTIAWADLYMGRTDSSSNNLNKSMGNSTFL